ncbi:hypothetical protein GX50_05389 [[Emmonsia] crescens]|uniref:Uncharacterized protein n=1 Tax=[Emmonsia] crescens TaxID=73230 RepID=A0A2B7ZGA1_9EURO|nr:hypothetical protein GX50_05389 [Emmonsia crescens]
MKYSVALFTVLGLISLSAAVPKYEPYYDPNWMWPSDEPWDWCSQRVTCNDDADCYTSDCMDLVGQTQGLITCGTWPWWPHSCWGWIPSSKQSETKAVAAE